jgi:hypothetical protein
MMSTSSNWKQSGFHEISGTCRSPFIVFIVPSSFIFMSNDFINECNISEWKYHMIFIWK